MLALFTAVLISSSDCILLYFAYDDTIDALGNNAIFAVNCKSNRHTDYEGCQPVRASI